MAIFNSHVSLPEGTSEWCFWFPAVRHAATPNQLRLSGVALQHLSIPPDVVQGWETPKKPRVEVFKIFSSILSKHCPNTYQSEQIVLSLHPMAPYPWFFWCLGMCRSSGSNYRSSVNCRMQFGTQKIIKNPWPPILGAQLLIKWFWVQWCPFFWSYAPNAPGFPRLCFRWPSGTRSFSLRTWKGRNEAPKMFVRWGLEIHIGSLTCVYHYISSLVLLS